MTSPFDTVERSRIRLSKFFSLLSKNLKIKKTPKIVILFYIFFIPYLLFIISGIIIFLVVYPVRPSLLLYRVSFVGLFWKRRFFCILIWVESEY